MRRRNQDIRCSASEALQCLGRIEEWEFWWLNSSYYTPVMYIYIYFIYKYMYCSIIRCMIYIHTYIHTYIIRHSNPRSDESVLGHAVAFCPRLGFISGMACSVEMEADCASVRKQELCGVPSSAEKPPERHMETNRPSLTSTKTANYCWSY